MSSSEKFCLKWNDFKENINTVFGSLREDCDFTDVTLACEDGQQVEAHKVILAASSPFFQNLLKTNKHPHPLIYMRGLRSEDLVAMVDFLYYGEANVYQENLDSFLAIAEELKLKGLTGENETEETSLNVNDSKPKFWTEKMPKLINTKKEETSAERTIAVKSNSRDLDQQIQALIVAIPQADGQEKTYACQVCGKQFSPKNLSHLRDHIETLHIDGLAHPCNFCEKTFRSRNSLRLHTYHNHRH
jgi:hypothetical protein